MVRRRVQHAVVVPRVACRELSVSENVDVSIRKVALNPAQLEVLTWVRAGSPDAVYTDWSHRVTARALHNRSLVIVTGHGAGWSATLTDDGAYYLENGTYPTDSTAVAEPSAMTGKAVPEPRQPRQARMPRPSVTPRKAEAPKPKKPGPVDEMMAALQNAEGHHIAVPASEESRYRQLASAAKRFGRVPDGMQISVSWSRNGQSTVTLESLPAWQTVVLEPVAVPKRLRDPSDVVIALSESGAFQVTGEPRKRALRLVEALVVTARERRMTVSPLLNQPVNRDYYGRDGARRDEVEFVLDDDRFRVWFTQATLQEPHEPTRREIARVQYGYLFPDVDEVPDEHLGLVLDGEGGKFWASNWKDTDEHQLENDLAQVLEEIRLRHDHLVEQRQAERERRVAEKRQHEEDSARAVLKYRKQFLIDTMNKQARRWEEATALRQYADAVRAEAERLNGDERDSALAWAEQIEAQASRTDPLPSAATPPDIPEPSGSDLAPFMKSRGPYGW